ncbi:MAG: hypothetical protein K2Q26_06740 [Bdellovibrionales bacterium]|nr:hypothetical protein [Bdellovibrionales bacterium]
MIQSKTLLGAHLFFLLLLCAWSSPSLADFKPSYFGGNYSINGSNGIVTHDTSAVALEYMSTVDFLRILPTESPYQWYYDVSLGAQFHDLKDPLQYLGISNTPQSTSDVQVTKYYLETGFTRHQELYSALKWVLGARIGAFSIHAQKLSGQTQSAQDFRVQSSTSLGLMIFAFSGVNWEVSENWDLQTSIQIRKYYLGDFFVQDQVSGKEYRYPDYTSIGFAVGLLRSF